MNNNRDLAERRALIQSDDPALREARLQAVESTIRSALYGAPFEARLAARDLEEVGIVVTKGGYRAAA